MTASCDEIVDATRQDNVFLALFERFERSMNGADPDWFFPVRKAAMAKFCELGFPTTRDDEWRYTNVAPVARTPFESGSTIQESIGPDDAKPYRFASDGGIVLTFVNGVYRPDLSTDDVQADGVTVKSLSAAIAQDDPCVREHLTRYASVDGDAFAALNTAMTEDGAVVHVARGKVIERPIHLLFLTQPCDVPIAMHPRVLLVAGAHSQATVVEQYVGLGDGVYLTNAVTEIFADEDSVVDHYRVGREGGGAYHIGALQLHQQRGSNVTSHSIWLGGLLVRNNVGTKLNGEGCECTLNGFYMVRGKEHVDNHLVVDHAQPHGDSREFYKGILEDSGRGIFSGRIMVREGAQKTDAKQTNRSLLLSPDAQIESKPQLEILADDVKCTHGATIGQVGEEALYYLRTRGLTAAAARSLLIYAFAKECLDKMRVGGLRSQLHDLVLARLPQGSMFREAE